MGKTRTDKVRRMQGRGAAPAACLAFVALTAPAFAQTSLDRYGGVLTPSLSQGRFLQWPGKSGADPAPDAAAPTQVEVRAEALSERAPLSGARASAPKASPALGGTGVRLYSLHRDYGLEPDPAPIPPDAFTSAPDLAAEDLAAAQPPPGRLTAAGRLAITSARQDSASEPQP